ncbi:GNAT family N-acetyltransferase [Nocardioides dongxiaopingii]|uniref:GNAT family N-acetyltransferase n=1 Tax=Nocardioides sp. S-1144 TaxID=2582905 RepID=UPI00110EF7B0|nr:GNAT family N-acetyltransferase [Nocardioides sp. S-1144]QCW50097.1 GNAT family N-acetyltransferase [Nocardioides sp. S-1144]
MSGLEVARLDPFDDATFALWHATRAAALEDAVGVAAAQVYDLAETRVQWQEPSDGKERVGYVGRAGGEVVAVGVLVLPQRDNLTKAFVEVAVAPAHQRRGHGRTMLEHVEAAAVAAGRSLLDAEVPWRHEHGTDGTGSRDVAFARAAGFALGLSDVQRWLDVPADAVLLDALAAEAAPHHRGYELRSWVGDVPDELAEGWLVLDASLATEAPTGDIEVEDPDVDVALLRQIEANVARQGRTSFHTVALDAAGTVVAYSMIVHGRSTTAFQWGTLVHRDHRGHRLGTAVKVANHRLLEAERPDVVRVSTWNAEVNDHMIGVNDRMGFRPVSRMGEFQKRLT